MIYFKKNHKKQVVLFLEIGVCNLFVIWKLLAYRQAGILELLTLIEIDDAISSGK